MRGFVELFYKCVVLLLLLMICYTLALILYQCKINTNLLLEIKYAVFSSKEAPTIHEK